MTGAVAAGRFGPSFSRAPLPRFRGAAPAEAPGAEGLAGAVAAAPARRARRTRATVASGSALRANAIAAWAVTHTGVWSLTRE